jgi:ComF family protein
VPTGRICIGRRIRAHSNLIPGAVLAAGPGVLRPAANALVRLFLSPGCAACGLTLARPLDSPVCAACWRGVRTLSPPWCTRCGDLLPSWRTAAPLCPRCRRILPRLALARSAGVYDGALREIVHAFKYRHCRALARPLAALMIGAGGDVLDGAHAAVPVPLHPLRSLRRGFNQADDLARALGLPVWRVLRRLRHGPPQASLPAARRHGNVRAAFGLRSFVDRRRLQGRTIVLVDDVMTTGATLDACAEVLQRAGVRNVRALTAARAVANARQRQVV